MTVRVDMGTDERGSPVPIDLEELLATRLLVQGNSGSGKSHLLRRLLEKSAGQVQQVVIDPEGDFVTLSKAYGHVVIEAGDYAEREVGRFGARIREHRASVVLSLEGLEIEGQMRCAATFLNALFDAPREHWYPALVVVDEAQLFAPTTGGEVTEEVRRASLSAMTNLMCRGRKRGLAGVIATQRLAKLAKNVAAEASNFLMGRTFLDIDMARAADLLGMERKQAEQIRDLERGQFLALGPAIARRPQLVRIGTVATTGRGGAPALTPLPTLSGGDAHALVLETVEKTPPPPPPRVAPPQPVEELLAQIDEAPVKAAAEPDGELALFVTDTTAVVDAVMRDIVVDPDSALRPAAALFPDFAIRCRMRGVPTPPLDAQGFSRSLSLARAGLFAADLADEGWAAALRIADRVPEDMLGVFMLIARAAREEAPCPTEEEVARVYGTSSMGRVRRLLGYMESKAYLAFRVDLRGRRTAAIPELGWSTAPEEGEGEGRAA